MMVAGPILCDILLIAYSRAGDVVASSHLLRLLSGIRLMHRAGPILVILLRSLFSFLDRVARSDKVTYIVEALLSA